MIVIAGAGSGKTRVLTYRVAYLIAERKAPPDGIMAVTFTNKAAGEMVERIVKLIGVRKFHPWIGTFHRTCANILRNYGAEGGLLDKFTVFDDSEQLAMIKRALKKLEMDPKAYAPKNILNRISIAKVRLIGPDEYDEKAKDYMERATAQIYRIYQDGLREQRGYDFDDLIMEACNLLKNCESVRDSLSMQYRYVLIDEFQDINQAQYEFIKLIVEPSRKNVFAVGDDDQSIYAFRGANVRFLDNFQKDFAPVKLIKLEQNYRSTTDILNLANEIIKQKSWGMMKKLWTQIKGTTKPRFFLAESESDEAFFVAQMIREKTDHGASLNDFVVLYRTNAQSRSFEEVLGHLSIRYKIIGGLGFYQRMEIKDVLAYLRVMVNEKDLQALDRCINTPHRGLGDKSKDMILELLENRKIGFYELAASRNENFYEELPTRIRNGLDPFIDIMLEFKKKSKELKPVKLVDWLLEKTGYEEELRKEDTIESQARLDNLNELRGAIASFTEEYPNYGIDRYLENVSLYTKADAYDETEESVTLMTLHNAKGLEFEHVFLTGLEEGLLPHFRSILTDEVDEELRLFYVGVTRARKNLNLCAARSRHFQRYSPESKLSRFLKVIPRDCLEGLEILDEFKQKRDEIYSSRNRRASYRERMTLDEVYFEEEYMESEDRSDSEILEEEQVRIKPSKYKIKKEMPSNYSVGDRIYHKFFGEGEIEEIISQDDDNFLTIRFEKFGRKILSEKGAPLNPIEE